MQPHKALDLRASGMIGKPPDYLRVESGPLPPNRVIEPNFPSDYSVASVYEIRWRGRSRKWSGLADDLHSLQYTPLSMAKR